MMLFQYRSFVVTILGRNNWWRRHRQKWITANSVVASMLYNTYTTNRTLSLHRKKPIYVDDTAVTAQEVEGKHSGTLEDLAV